MIEVLEDRTLLAVNPFVENVVSRWEFNEGTANTAFDTVDGNDGTLTNGPTWTTGLIDGALSFDGFDDLVSIPDAANLDLTTALTTEAWVRFDAVGDFYETILSKAGDSNNQSYSLRR